MRAAGELVVSTGDPQGIGPEIAVAACQRALEPGNGIRMVLVGDPDLLRDQPGGENLTEVSSASGAGVHILPVPLPGPLRDPGPTPAGGRAALEILERSWERLQEVPGSALVTAPVSKEAITDGGTLFHGHTGWLAGRAGIDRPVMLFVAGDLRVALATVHVPVREVSVHLSEEALGETLQVLSRGLTDLFGVPSPRIAVLGLNPHAGEGGLLGDEETRVIGPAVETFNAGGGHAAGPFSADSFFHPERLAPWDAVLAMYHDQGLLPVKALSLGKAVNVTLGLPFVRTSVDHGCAFDLAGRGTADCGSLIQALNLASDLLQR